MKKLLLMLIVIACILSICSCGTTMQTEDEASKSEDADVSMFVLLEDCESSYGFIVVYHKDTKVIYTISKGMYNSGNFTVMLNPDGTPMVYGGAK